MKTKLTAQEKRAKAFCEEIKRTGNGSFRVTWTKSAMWGRTAKIVIEGDIIAFASGCGYCKESSVIAEALRWLGDSEEQAREIWTYESAGVGSIRRLLEAMGWVLEENNEIYTVKKL
jgi:hypothetical protein